MRRCDTDVALVVFGGLAHGFAIPPFEFERTLQSFGLTTIFLRDLGQSWYTDPLAGVSDGLSTLPSGIDEVLAAVHANKALAIGNSSGGFAALHCAFEAPRIGGALVFAPQTNLTARWRERHRDARWSGHVARVHANVGSESPVLDLANRHAPDLRSIDVYSSAFHRLDMAHALRIRAREDVRVHPVIGRSHHPVRRLRSRGQLAEVVRRSITAVRRPK